MRRVDTLARDLRLPEIETDFLIEAHRATAGLPRGDRSRFAHDLGEMLSERPAAYSRHDLHEALGSPGDVADSFRIEHGLEGWIPPWRLWWAQPRRTRFLQIGLFVAVLGIGLAWGSYRGATPQIINNCSGARATAVETLHAAGETEYRMPLRIGERYGIFLCPYSLTPGVTIDRVYLANPVLTAIQPVGWELDLQQHAETAVGDASDHHPWRPDEVPWGAHVIVWFEAEYCNIAGGISFDRLTLDYRYRGRSRSTEIDLLATYSVWAAPDQCSDAVWAANDALDRVWLAAVDQNLVSSVAGFGLDGIGPLGLWPVSVSRDLCRFLRGVEGASEPLAERAVFHLDDDVAATLIDGAVLGICPEFADRRDELVAMLGDGS